MSGLLDAVVRLAQAWQPPSDSTTVTTTPDKDLRAFGVCVHDRHGVLLLHCTRKKNKPPHHQLPGGHVDEPEWEAAASSPSPVLFASRAGMARELFEETGMDIRTELTRRAVPLVVFPDQNPPNVYKNRAFFVVPLTDDDFVRESPSDPHVRVVPPMRDVGSKLMLKLSVEHSGFTFESDPEKVKEMLNLHSGGKVSEALKKALDVAKTADK